MIFGRQRDFPEEISKAGLDEWYSEMSDQNKVKLGRYLKNAETSSALGFSLSVMETANMEENHSLTVLVGENILKSNLTETERFDVLEKLIPAYFGVKRYDDCLKCCNDGIGILENSADKIKHRKGDRLPETLMCRNYTVNVLVGAYGDYDAGDEAMDRFCEMGLMSEEDVRYRKQSHKIRKLQRTFDGVFSVKLKNQ
ncbi:MAG: hypothetical protein LBJ20_04575 [Candidatus Methanoplasma sp.]|jgi:hypothetical protein|nr:hypothetical protein [Candidatus Methanoplasma sp.]